MSYRMRAEATGREPPSLLAPSERAALRGRIGELAREVDEPEAVDAVLAHLEDPSRSADGLRDVLSTELMALYRRHQSRACFGLLYELNRAPLLQQVTSRLRRYQSTADPNDVLQEVFFNVYRYPHRFDSSREDAFRVWTATIVRNTVLKHLRSLSRSGRAEVPFEDLSEHPQEENRGPLRGVIDREAESECQRVYLTYLHLYLRFYSMLSERERRAIHLVEVDEFSYREAAARLAIKLENLKMVIFRARRKIHRAMRRVFEGLPPDCRPARDPRPPEGGGEASRERMARRAESRKPKSTAGGPVAGTPHESYPEAVPEGSRGSVEPRGPVES